jgi:hypothetical protein
MNVVAKDMVSMLDRLCKRGMNLLEACYYITWKFFIWVRF